MESVEKGPKILISGSGIAGSTFAFWALRAFQNAHITMVERWPGFRLTGSSVDLRGSAIEIIERMGMLDDVRHHSTREKGIRFVQTSGKTLATMNASGRTDVQSATSEFEIFRSDLAQMLLEPSKNKIRLRFGDYVEKYEIDEKSGAVKVKFAKSDQIEVFDYLVAADGLGSRIRGQMLDARPRDQIYDQGVHVAYFTHKEDLLQGSKFAEMYNATRGRVIMIRPDPNPAGRCKILLMKVTLKTDHATKANLNDAIEAGPEACMNLLKEDFHDAGYKADKVLAGLRESDDFYCSIFAQVRSPKLTDTSGRVVLLGDAGYATPGLGTSLAITGAYVLAGEMLKTWKSDTAQAIDLSTASLRYEEIMLPFVRLQQKDAGAIQTLNPQTQWGIGVRNVILRFMTITRLDRLLMMVAAKLEMFDKKMELPEYSWPSPI